MKRSDDFFNQFVEFWSVEFSQKIPSERPLLAVNSSQDVVTVVAPERRLSFLLTTKSSRSTEKGRNETTKQLKLNRRSPFCRRLSRRLCRRADVRWKVHVLAVEYPGYGICPGVATGPSVMENAFSALHFATQSLRWPLETVS